MKIAQYLRQSPWGDVTPENISNGMGGRETAVVQIGENLAKLGHEVVTFAPVTKQFKSAYPNGGSCTYTSPDNITGGVVVMQPDLLITWEDPRLASLNEVRDACKKIVMGMQVAHVLNEDLTLNSLKDLDHIVCLSNYAVNVFYEDNIKHVSMSQFEVIPNCVDYSKFKKKHVKNKTPTAIYSSSPDRGLQNLVHVWPKVREKIPNAELHVCYGVENWFKHVLFNHSRDGQHALEIRDFLGIDNNLNKTKPAADGVIYHGKVGQKEVHSLMSQSHLLAFPAETQSPTETGCITVIEALASECHPVLGDSDCLFSEFSSVATFADTPIDHDKYANLIIDGFNGALIEQNNKVELGKKFAANRDWSRAAKMYADLVEVAK